MEIHSDAFDIIHNLVGEKHFKRLTPDERRQRLKMSQDLWGAKRKGEYLIREAIRPSGKIDIVKTERTRIRKETKECNFGTIDNFLIISLLKFIDLRIDDPIFDRDVITLTEREAENAADNLFAKFVKKHYPTYYKDHPNIHKPKIIQNFEITDSTSNGLPYSTIDDTRVSPYIIDYGPEVGKILPTTTFVKSNFFLDIKEEIEFNIPLIKRHVEEYLLALSEKRYDRAMRFWDDNLVYKKWNRDEFEFSFQFSFTEIIYPSSIKVWNIWVQDNNQTISEPAKPAKIEGDNSVFDNSSISDNSISNMNFIIRPLNSEFIDYEFISKNENMFDTTSFSAQCYAFYEEFMKPPYIDEFYYLENCKVHELEKFSVKIKELYDRALARNYRDFGKLKIKDLLNYDQFDRLNELQLYDHTKIKKLFPERTEMVKYRLLKITLSTKQHESGNYIWRITDTEPVTSYVELPIPDLE